MPFEATHVKCLTDTTVPYGDTFKLIIVNDIKSCGLIGVGGVHDLTDGDIVPCSHRDSIIFSTDNALNAKR